MLKLVKMAPQYITQLNEMMDEWYGANEKIIPWSIRKSDYHNIDEYMRSLETKEAYGEYVPDSTYFCLDIFEIINVPEQYSLVSLLGSKIEL